MGRERCRVRKQFDSAGHDSHWLDAVEGGPLRAADEYDIRDPSFTYPRFVTDSRLMALVVPRQTSYPAYFYGEAVVGNIGTPDRVEYTAIGRTVNLAARLCDNARPGEILVSEQVRERLGDGHPLVAREPLRMKGFDEPIQTFAVVRAAGG